MCTCRPRSRANAEASRRLASSRSRFAGVRALQKRGSDFHSFHAQQPCRLDLAGIRIDEQGHLDASRLEALHRIRHGLFVGHDVQAPFGRQFLPPFGYERGLVRPHFAGNGDDRVGRCHFEVETATHHLAEQPHVAILDVPPVLAQMNRDPIRPREHRQHRRCHRIWLIASPCLAQRGNVIDVHSQSNHGQYTL